MNTRKTFFKKIIGGPILYAVAIIVSFFNVYFSIAIYIIIPLLFVILPKAELADEEWLKVSFTDHAQVMTFMRNNEK